jgi:Spx/MgsR family transcriptional regulator
MLTLYGIPNCDTCRKARKWLEAHSLSYRFHDLRADGLDEQTLRRWLRHADWKKVLNTRSTTWRKIPPAEKDDLDQARAIALMLANPTLVKRPVLEADGAITIGFSPDRYRVLSS